MAKKNPYLNDKDILDQALEHSWGKTADAKAKEKAYNREYYQRHKEEILRKARQAGEGIQRTAQNAYNQARAQYNAARGSGQLPSQQIRRAGEDVRTAFSKDRRGSSSVDSAKTNKTSEMNSRLRNEGRARYNEAARNADELSRYERNYRQGRAHNPTYTREYNNYIGREANRAIDESNRAYKNASRMAKRASSSGAAANEASKASQQQGYEKRFDSKLVRDAQIAYSKARGTARKAKDAVDRYVDDTLDYAKKLNKDARTGINDAYNRAKSGIEDVYSQASRKTKNVKNDLETSKRLRQMKNADALLKAVNRLPSDKYEETQELARKLRSANAQAYNQASKTKKKKKS